MFAGLARSVVAAGRQELREATGRVARTVALSLAAGVFLLIGFGFFVAAAVVALVPVVGGWQAALIVGGAFALVGLIILSVLRNTEVRRARERALEEAETAQAEAAKTSKEDSLRLMMTAFNVGLSLGRRDGK